MNEVGTTFAYRERVRAYGEPVRPVEVSREGPPRSNKVRVRWLDGEYEGLEVWVPKVRLLAPWEEAQALLQDERKMLAAVAASEEDASDRAEWEAVEKVLETLSSLADPGEEVSLGYKAAEENLLAIQNLDAAARRFDLGKREMLAEPHAFVDRSGWYKAPFRTAVGLARQFCRRFPREVLDRMEKDEDELRQQLVSGDLDFRESWWIEGPRREYAEKRLRELEPVHAVIREWCGQEATEEFDQMLALREEVDRLRDLLQHTAGWLKHNGHPVKAGLLRKELGRSPKAD